MTPLTCANAQWFVKDTTPPPLVADYVLDIIGLALVLH